jgi:hypothetical protein
MRQRFRKKNSSARWMIEVPQRTRLNSRSNYFLQVEGIYMKKIIGIVAVATIAIIGGTASAKDLDAASPAPVIGQALEGQFSSTVAVGLDGVGHAVTGGTGRAVTGGTGRAVTGGTGRAVTGGTGRAVTGGTGRAVTGGTGRAVTGGTGR